MATPIAPALLLFDLENPRIPFQEHRGQREALLAMTKGQEDTHLLSLIADIVSFGLSPAELPIVTPSKSESGRFIVLDGNRRLSAIRALESPDGLSGEVRLGILEQIRKLSAKYQRSPISAVDCVVVEEPNDAEHWLFLRHTGRNSGAGTVDWGPHEKARFRAKAGGGAELHTRLLDFLEEGGHLQSADRKRVPASNFRRLIETRSVLERLGIEAAKDGSFRFHDEAQAINGLLYIVNDLAAKTTKVTDIYTKEQRKKYADNLPASVVPIPKVKSAQPAATAHAASPARVPRVPLARLKQPRTRLIPSDCFLRITDPRIRTIEIELRSLDLGEFVNAAAVLFRVFLELSADAYIENATLSVSADPTLRSKLQQVTNDLLAKNQLTAKQAVPVRRACAKDSFLAPSVTLMHQFIHCHTVFPSPGDLRANWDNLQPFFIAVWPR